MIIAISNHKGGTGKTTTTINLGIALARKKKKVLLVDMDPQGNLSFSMGVEQPDANVADLMLGYEGGEHALFNAGEVDLIAAELSVLEYEDEIREDEDGIFLLKRALMPIKDDYDYILIDCSPALSLLTINALNAADQVLIPMQFDILSIKGLEQILVSIGEIKSISNPSIEVMGVLGVIVDERRQLTREVQEYVGNNFEVEVFNNYIRSNVKAAEAPSFAISVLDHAPQSNSARDYIAVAAELIKRVGSRVKS